MSSHTNIFPIQIVHELPHRIRLRQNALHDPSLDVSYFEAMLYSIEGVSKVRINARAASVIVCYNGHKATRERIVYSCRSIPSDVYRLNAQRKHPHDPLSLLMQASTLLLGPLFPRPVAALVSWISSLQLFLKGLDTFINNGIKVEVLDAAAVGFSMMRCDYTTAGMIRLLLALGEYLEQLSEEKTSDLLKSLLRPQVETIWVERDGQELQLTSNELIIGDRVICGTGEMIPIDGIVVCGEASVNQSSITGESIPVRVSPESEVISGSVIEEGRITIKALQVGSETGMARISRFIENSMRMKSPSQTYSTQLADRLVPITFALGLLIYALSRDVRRAASVLTVDYSCAMKLASPVAVKVAMYTAAHCGVLLKGAQALEAFATVNTIVFDKTGTLTRGVLHVIDVVSIGSLSNDELLCLAAGAEEHYAHPAADAVVRAAKERQLALPPITRVDFIVAHGVSASVDGSEVLVGSYHFIAEDEGIDCAAVEQDVAVMYKEGRIPLFVARDGILEGLVVLQDQLRPEACGVLRELKELGMSRIVVLTGDHRDTAKALAKELDGHIDALHWELLPEDKAHIAKALQKDGNTIAFVGDGVNDAPVLVTADVGICMPHGADLARESAQVVLLKDDLSALVTARRLAMQAQRTMTNCFLSTVGVNSLLLVLASSGTLPPVLSALLHNLTTVGILAYAALAGMQKPEQDTQSQEDSYA
ncbi:heavy metal translocating P-type ATPase [candidate division KSB3 bacterium]|uniref:Heavy metal translocating P-type ATPase n=1 Tax=candidate division KSB3 bacterium TaxID=2044937 RepID=A0A2G6E769_9BACT|nr:MAG: heavy metal translocating P-type ATPase [candidate division KSB3 bacterium]PIE29970.1 MAG: heavy metal translocating P-type ATPase [candidate division KSB3 bacterium]